MPTMIMALLILAAVGVLASSWLSGRRDRDPAASVDSFHRAMNAMQNTQPPGPGTRPADARDPEAAAQDGVASRR